MGLKLVVLLLSLVCASFGYADCPNCRGQQAPKVQVLPDVGVQGMTMKIHLERDHQINTAGMTPAQMQEAHNAAHYGTSVVTRSRTVTRIAPRRKLFPLFWK